MEAEVNGKDDLTTTLEDEIEEGHVGCTCPLCDNEILDSDSFITVCAHGNRYLAHAFCVEALSMGDDEELATAAPARG